MAFVAATTGQDREDWIGLEAMNAAPLWRNLSGTINHNETTGLFDVRRWPFLHFIAFNLTAARTMWILVQWFDDPATLNIIGTINYTNQLGARIVDTVPNLGPYCLVTVFWDDAANHAATCIIMGRNVPSIGGVGDGGASAGSQIVVSRPAGPLAPGVLVFQNAAFVQRGWAVFEFYAQTTGIQIGLQWLDGAGVWQFFGEYFTNAGSIIYRDWRTVALPSHMIRAYVFNQTGGALDAGYVLTMAPSPY